MADEMQNETRHTPAPWFENGEWTTEPKVLLSNEADANLIAAAPELFAIALRVAELFENTDAPLGIDARAAVNKALGKS